MANLYKLALYTGVFAVLFQLLCLLMSWNILGVIGALILSFIAGYVLLWLIEYHMPRKIMYCKDKAVLITGCDSGFGFSLALRLDSLCFKVYAGCLHADGAGAEDLKSKASERLHVIQLDVTNQEQINAAFQIINSTLDICKLWAVINNAGISTHSLIEWCPVDSFSKLIDVNTMGPVRVIKTFLPLLRESQGRIIIVASAAGRMAIPFLAAYAMSKAAVISLADGLRRELRTWGVTVHTIEPSFYKTGMVGEHIYDEIRDHWNQCSDSLRSAYGEEFFESSLQSFRNVVNKMIKPVDDIYMVIDDVVDAVAGTNPKLKYVPYLWNQLYLGALQALPTRLVDWEVARRMPMLVPAAKRNITC